MAIFGVNQLIYMRRVASARRHARAGQWQEASNQYRRALALDASRAATWLQLAHSLKHSDDLQEAEEAYRKAVAFAPDSFENHRQLAFFLRAQGRDAEATPHFAAALAFNPDDSEIALIVQSACTSDLLQERMAFGAMSGATGNKARSRSWATQLACARLRRGARRAARNGNWAVAGSNYRALLDHAPDDAAAWLQLGHAEREQGLHAGAALAYRHAVALAPLNPEALVQLGYSLKDRGKDQAAAFYFQRALQLQPGNSAASLGLAALGATASIEGPDHLSGHRFAGAVPVTAGPLLKPPPPLRRVPHLTPVTMAELDNFMDALTRQSTTPARPAAQGRDIF